MNDFETTEAAFTAGSQVINEICGVGAGVGGGFKDTHELHVMKFKQAMKTPNKDKWMIAVKEELNRFKKFEVFEVIKLSEVPKHAKMLTTTWAMKMKSNGTFRARLNMRGYEQIDGERYASTSISSPVTNDASIRVLLVLMIMVNCEAYIVDVQGAFLHG